MKNLLPKFLLALLITFCFLGQNTFAQTVTLSAFSGTLSSNPINVGAHPVLFGFTVQVSGGSKTFNKFTFTTSNNSTTNFTNGTLYRTTTSGYSSSGAKVGNVTFSGTNVTIDGFTETLTNTTYYYYLVADIAGTGYNQFVISYGSTLATDVSGTTYNTAFYSGVGYNINAGTTPALTVTNLTTDVQASGALLSGASNLKLFQYSVTNNTGSSITINSFKVNSSVSDLSKYLTTIRLYANTTNTFPASSTATGSTAASSPYVTFSSLTETIGAGATKYYWVYANTSFTGSLPQDLQLSFQDAQSSAAITTSTSATYNTFTAQGNTYNLNTSNVTISNLTGGISSGTVTLAQTDIVMFGFSVNSSAAITVSQFNINSTNTNVSTYFGNAKLYYNTTNTYATGTKTLAGTVSFSGGYANVTLTAQNTFTSGQTRYYFLVADNIGAISPSQSVAFSFGAAQSQNAVVQSSPIASVYNNFTTTGSTVFTIPAPGIVLTGLNSAASNNITTSISPGTTNIAVFGFQVQAFGAVTIDKFNMAFGTGNENLFFTNGRLVESTDNVFSTGDLSNSLGAVATGGSSNANIGNSTALGLTFNNNTRYFFLVVDVKVYNNSGAPATSNYSFVTGSATPSAVVFGSPYSEYNPPAAITGATLNFPPSTTFIWTGGANNTAYTTTSNWSNFASPTSGSDIVIPGGLTYYPAITSNTTIGSLTFSGSSPSLTINSGIVLTSNTGLIIGANVSPTITGGTLSLASGSTSTIASTAVLTLGASTVISNSGTLTLKSDASGSATIAAIPATSSITGNVSVERYFTGGQSYSRGYRLLSSPVSVSSSSRILPNLSYIVASAYTTGTTGSTNGFDVAGNPTLYFYRENMAPNYSTFLSGNFRGVGKINNSSLFNFTIDGDATTNTLPAGNGFLFFFRGNRASNATTNTAAVAQTATFTVTGYLNQGNVAVNHWTSTAAGTAGSAGLLYTSATLNTAVRGYNLVGNPYASSIDWDKFGTNITGVNISNTIYIYNPTLKVYATYIKGSSGTGTNFNGTGANIIPSGQGFFVRASGTSPTLTFTEAAKVNTQVPVANLLMSAPENSDNTIAEQIKPQALMATPAAIAAATATAAPALQYMRIQLVLDANNKEDALIFFKSGAKPQFVVNEDAEYLRGNNSVSIATRSSDNRELAINQMAYPTKAYAIPLTVKIGATGIYQLKLTELKNIPATYGIWLIDKWRKDSLDIRNNKTYNFNANIADTTSYGSKRFSLVIRPTKVATPKLVDFTANALSTGAQLIWTTQYEGSGTTFTIERSTNAGKTWDVISSVISSAKSKYYIVDRFPLVGKNYYRLKIDDANGNTTYSANKLLVFAKQVNSTGSNVSVYPNPVSTVVNVAVVAQVNAKSYTFRVTSGNGTLVRTGIINTTLWQSTVTTLKPGTYFVQVVNNTTKALVGNGKFIKN
ncbi:hypothetical protein FFF34_010875 [Inquilinus sp. KBS0705]|nr:hypothetical protein FFF34_010875 [Inquilinus sp. KBS0705]